MQAGAYDCLPKHKVSDKSLSRVIGNTLEKHRLRREIKEARKKMTEMSITDELTGLYNRRYFIEILEQEVSRAERYKTDLALCMIDMDHFKRINDTYGHPAGDMVLSEVGELLHEGVRHSDLCCRYGDDELAVILPNTKQENADKACEKFLRILGGHMFKYESSFFYITVSIGIASHRPSTSPDDLIACVDNALYQAKENGRNRIFIYGK